MWKSALVFLGAVLISLPFWFMNFWVFIIILSITFSGTIVLFYLSIAINRQNSNETRTII
jgi:hypothetical protein